MIRLDIDGDKDILKSIDKLDNDLKAGSKVMNQKRAKSFQKFTRQATIQKALRLKPISKATKIIQGKNHPPLYNKGELLLNMKIRPKGSSYEVGFFRGDRTFPTGKRYVSSINFKSHNPLTWYQIAVIQAAGYRIPLQGVKGDRVRRFLAAHGIFVKRTKSHLTVKPRPLLKKAMTAYNRKGIDQRIIDKHLAQLYSKL